MRDPARIEKILEVVRGVWERYPDLRLGQLIGNAADIRNVDSYYIEDDDLEDELWGMIVQDEVTKHRMEKKP
jgi:hypothetical protein